MWTRIEKRGVLPLDFLLLFTAFLCRQRVLSLKKNRADFEDVATGSITSFLATRAQEPSGTKLGRGCAGRNKQALAETHFPFRHRHRQRIREENATGASSFQKPTVQSRHLEVPHNKS